MLTKPMRLRKHRVAGLHPRRDSSRKHHPDFNSKESQGWKAVEAEG